MTTDKIIITEQQHRALLAAQRRELTDLAKYGARPAAAIEERIIVAQTQADVSEALDTALTRADRLYGPPDRPALPAPSLAAHALIRRPPEHLRHRLADIVTTMGGTSGTLIVPAGRGGDLHFPVSYKEGMPRDARAGIVVRTGAGISSDVQRTRRAELVADCERDQRHTDFPISGTWCPMYGAPRRHRYRDIMFVPVTVAGAPALVQMMNSKSTRPDWQPHDLALFARLAQELDRIPTIYEVRDE